MAVAAVARSGLPGRSAPAVPPAAPGTWIYVRGAGDCYWRAEAPARAVGGRLAGVPEREAVRAFTQPNYTGRSRTAFPWLMSLEMIDGETVTVASKADYQRHYQSGLKHVDVRLLFPKVEGTAVWTRPDGTRAALMLAMQQQGIRTLSETDDNYFADPKHNLFLRHNEFSDVNRLEHARAMATADGMVFSTDLLRDQYVSFMRQHLGKRLIPETFVCRNHVPRSDWPERVEHDGPLRVGFMGSPSHVWDIDRAFAAFLVAHGEGCETVMIGYNPADPDPHVPDVLEGETKSWRSDESLENKRTWEKVISRHIPWIDPDQYHRAALPLDIGLAPLTSDAFTRGKSDVKAIEYTISGAAVVCENHPAYTRAGWVHEVNCLLASDPRQFGEQTLRLMDDPKLRYELVSAAQEYVATERNEDVLRREWSYALAG